MAARTRTAKSSPTVESSLTTRDTVRSATPAWRATSTIVGRRPMEAADWLGCPARIIAADLVPVATTGLADLGAPRCWLLTRQSTARRTWAKYTVRWHGGRRADRGRRGARTEPRAVLADPWFLAW